MAIHIGHVDKLKDMKTIIVHNILIKKVIDSNITYVKSMPKNGTSYKTVYIYTGRSKDIIRITFTAISLSAPG